MSSLEDPRPSDQVEREDHLLRLLQRVWTYPITTKSDIARQWADEIAEAASRGFLTTLVAHGSGIHGRIWKLTAAGLLHLEANGPRIAEKEVALYVEEYTAPFGEEE